MDEATALDGVTDTTSIRVSVEIADWLHDQKQRGESYDDVLRRLRDQLEE